MKSFLEMIEKNLLIIPAILIALALPQNRDYPDFEIVVNNNPYPEDIIIHTMSGEDHFMAILDTDLSIKWYINSGSRGMGLKVDGDKLTYFHKDLQEWRVLNGFMQETDTLAASDGLNADYHDFRLLSDGSYFILSYDSITVDMSELVENGNPQATIRSVPVIEEFNAEHELVMEWNGWDNLNIADYTHLNLTAPEFTWMHVNSIEIDYDNNILISDRRSDDVIKFDRLNGQVIWYLGGPLSDFTILNDPFGGFSKQHDARRLDNGNILLFDNGNNHNPPVSRAVEYEINEEDYTATMVWEYIHPENYLALAMGSIQRLSNGNTLINWGTLNGIGAVITEVDYEKNIVLEIIYPYIYHSYKVRKSNWGFDINLLVGDANLDDSINILDIIYLVNEILYNDSDPSVFDLYKIDIDKDGSIDVTDIIQLVNIILTS